jgi:hypothetical protein
MLLDDYQPHTPHDYEISNSSNTISPASPISLNDISMNTDVIQPETQTLHSLNTTSSYTNNSTTSKNSHSLITDSIQNYTDSQNSFDKFNQSVQKELDQLQNPTSPSTLNSWADETNNHQNFSKKDIRNQTPINEQNKIIEFCNEINQCQRDPESLVNFFIKIKNDKKGLPRTSLKAIFSKISHRDRDFFRTFARNDTIKGQHQIEYEKIEKEFHINYTKSNNIGYINRTTRKKIKTIINKALYVAYLRSADLHSLKFWEAAALLDYGFNFFFDPSLPKINYQDLLTNCEESIKMKLPNLPDNPDKISKSIKIKLPHAIPITSYQHTGTIANSLRTYFNFDLLPSSYFVQKPNLPNNPSNLIPELKNLFPLTKRSQLTDLKNLAN